MRYRLRDADGSITFINETLAGATAGLCQARHTHTHTHMHTHT
jgi:hypothetical protein